jgi:apolipoprotein N-acyltransferase
MTTQTFSDRLTQLPGWLACSIALIAGALAPLSLAPFHFWPIGIASTAIFSLLIFQQTTAQVVKRSFCFGLGFYGVGVSWVFVSIHFYGGASAAFAAFLTLLFVSFLAVIFSLPFYLFGRWLNRHALGLLVAFPVIWMLGEWLRSWLLTGFPWLYLGYAHVHTWLAGWAPVTGIFGLSFFVALTGVVIAGWCLRAQLIQAQTQSNRTLISASLLLGLIWLGGAGLKTVEWTELGEKAIQVAIVQPDIAQDIKWQADYEQPTLDLLTDMSSELWDNDWIIWPEAAVPLTYHDALPFLNQINQRADETDTGLITGIIYDDMSARRYYNSIAGFGNALGIYHKRRLVPFGEYVPLEDWLRGLIQFFDLPTSIISLGPQQQGGIRVKTIDIAPAVCYELAYPDLMAESAAKAQVLLNVSNLGWFGDSIGPPQFLQMGQMRALETGRYLVYSTNNGTSALINQRGQIEHQSQAFVAQTLSGAIYPATGLTPFMHWGSWPLIIFALALIAAQLMMQKQKSKPNPE